MFGYIKPYQPELRVCELETYKSVYCGLCRSMGRHTGAVSRLTLSYDFAFLAIVRMVLCDIKPNHKVRRCLVHPLKKKPMCEDNEALAYSAAAAAILTECKIDDDIADEKGMKRALARFGHVFAAKMRKMAEGKAPASEIEDCLSRLSQLEKAGCQSLDEAADTFGDLLGAVMAYGVEGHASRIAMEIGRSVGRYIYVLDAVDDLEDDLKQNKYNPLRDAGISPDSLSIAVRLDLTRLEAAVNLLDFTGKPDLEGIIKNIIYVGMPREADRVFKGACNCKNERSK